MQYRSTFFLVVALMLMLVACKPSEPAVETQPAAPLPPTPAGPMAAPASAQPGIETGFIRDMPYATLRGQLMAAGWLPLRDPMCWENVGGEARVCSELPEVESCSGDGHCVMHFANAAEGKRLRATTYGPFERWNVPGEEAAFAVESWQLSPVDAKSAGDAAIACPSRDFDAFLEAFSADERIERAFTAPLVKVAELGDGGDGAVFVYATAAAYDGFNVAFIDKTFHFVDPKGVEDASALALEVEPQGGSVRNVRYLYGMSEGNSYRFEERSDCWYLVEDPEPPSP